MVVVSELSSKTASCSLSYSNAVGKVQWLIVARFFQAHEHSQLGSLMLDY